MKKRLLAVMVLLCVIMPSEAWSSEPDPTLVIIDTGLDPSYYDQFSKNLIHEVCMIQWETCSNNSEFDEGQGAALILSSVPKKNSDWSHGTRMFLSAVSANPDIKIIFIRAVGYDQSGNRQGFSSYYLSFIFDWIYQNKDLYNIKAISLSQGHHNLPKRSDYCPKGTNLEFQINKLYDADVLTFVAAGNNGDKKRIDFPSCVSKAVSVSSYTNNKSVSSYSNFDPIRTDILEYELINHTVANQTIKYTGTSVSTQLAAAKYIYVKSLDQSILNKDILTKILKNKQIDMEVLNGKTSYNS